jgi:putative glutamine amidotransferase
MSKAPLIGITVGATQPHGANGLSLRIRSTSPRAVAAARGIPTLIPIDIDTDTLRAIYDQLDGVILSGGGDIEPARYGARASICTEDVDPMRDELEVRLTEWALADDKPLLGICRGIQVINVAMGGTLIQDISDEVPGSLRHDREGYDWFGRLTHDVRLDPGSRLHKALDILGESLKVNSLHHQAVGKLAPGLCMVGQASDGIIEGVEHPDRRFAVGVQWHPEALCSEHEPHQHLFEAFIAAASQPG